MKTKPCIWVVLVLWCSFSSSSSTSYMYNLVASLISSSETDLIENITAPEQMPKWKRFWWYLRLLTSAIIATRDAVALCLKQRIQSVWQIYRFVLFQYKITPLQQWWNLMIKKSNRAYCYCLITPSLITTFNMHAEAIYWQYK